MAAQLLALALLLLSVTCSASVDLTMAVTNVITSRSADHEPNPITAGPMSSALHDNTSSDGVFNLINTEEPATSPATTKGATGTPEPEARPTGVTAKEEPSTSAAEDVTVMSTTTEDPSAAPFTLRPVIERVTVDLPVTGHEDNKTDDLEATPSSRPSGETTRIPTTTKDPKTGMKTPEKSKEFLDYERKKLILIGVAMVILVLVLATILVAVVRCRRRRGSQSFQSQSRSSKRQEVWAGQVPELSDGRIMAHPAGVENGGTGNKAGAGDEQEMKTFISGGKTGDALEEVNEMGKGDASEEEPLLEGGSLGKGEAGEPPEEQRPTPTTV